MPVASRKCSTPVLSGVPMFMYKPVFAVFAFEVPQVLSSQPAAWKTLPVTWSIAGYPSPPNGEYTAPLPGGNSSPVAFV